MAEIRAEAEIGMAALDSFHDGVRIPQRCGFRVIVKADLDIVFLGEFFQYINGTDGLGGDAIQSQGFGELEILPRLFFAVRNRDDAEIDDGDLVFFRVLLHGADHLRRHVLTDFDVLVLGAKNLPGKNFHALCSRLRRFFDGFKQTEFFQRPALHCDAEAGLGDDSGIECLSPRTGGGSGDGGGKEREKVTAFHILCR